MILLLDADSIKFLYFRGSNFEYFSLSKILTNRGDAKIPLIKKIGLLMFLGAELNIKNILKVLFGRFYITCLIIPK